MLGIRRAALGHGGTRRARIELALLAAVALVPRLTGLGRFSLWLDEILQTYQTRGSLAETWHALEADAVHPPLDALATWALQHVGLSEHARRLWPVALGVATVVLLYRWTERHFGLRVARIAGLVAALSPLHVRYSQESRPYALALFCVLLALAALDRLLDDWSRRRVALVALALAASVWSLYLALLVVVPVGVLVLEAAARGAPQRRRAARHLLRWSLPLGLVLTAAYSPWLGVVARVAERPVPAAASDWSLATALGRWQDLTVAGVEGGAIAAAGIFALILALAGAGRAATLPAGRAVLAAAGAGTLGVELLLRASDHWSNARYDLMAWPFLVVLLALGVATAAQLTAAIAPGGRRAEAVIAGLLAAGLALGQLAGLADYYRRGRPDWQTVARAVEALAAGEARVLAANRWTEICLGHYLAPPPGGPELGAVPAGGEPGALCDAPCCYLVVGGWPRFAADLEDWDLLASYSNPVGATRILLREAAPEATCPRALAAGLARNRPLVPAGALAARLRPPRETTSVDFGAATPAGLLGHGWSYPETSGDGTTFVWAAAREAALTLAVRAPRPLELELELWPFPVPERRQIVTVLLDGRLLAERVLAPGPQTVVVPLPAAALRRGANEIVLRFAYAVAPADIDPASPDRRRLAAALDRLTLRPPRSDS